MPVSQEEMDEIQTQQKVFIYTLYPPVGVGILLLLTLYIALALYLVIDKHVERSSKRVPGFIKCLVKITFRGSLIIKGGNGDSAKEFRVFGYRVPAGLINSLGLTAMLVWVGVVAAFWIVLIGKSKSTVYPDECWNDSITIDCEPIMYNKVSLDYVRALGASGGLLVLTTVIIHGQTIVLMWMMKKSQTANKRLRQAWKLAVIMMTVTPLLIEVVTFAAAGVFIIYLSLYESLQNWIQFGSFMIAVFHSTYFPCIILYHTWKRRTQFSRSREADIELGVSLSNNGLIRKGTKKRSREENAGTDELMQDDDGLNSPLL